MDSNILFTKMNGAGNDFIIIDQSINAGFIPGKSIIRKLCDRKRGIGADGVFILNLNSEKYTADFYNSDGSEGSLCGNGSRCCIRFLNDNYPPEENKISLKFRNEVYIGEILSPGIVKFYLRGVKKLKTGFKIKVQNRLVNAHFADNGSPHVVIDISEIEKIPGRKVFYDDIREFPVYEFGREIRYSNDFAPEGTNVNFVSLQDNKYYIRTYERGVENETDACGTGTAASAVVLFALGIKQPPYEFTTKAGDLLIIDFEFKESRIKNLSLTGPADYNFAGSINLKDFD